MPRIIRPIALLSVVAAVAYAVRVRRLAKQRGAPDSDVLGDDLRAFMTHRFDPVVMRLGLVGGRRSPWTTVEHVGRVTGAVHRTPVTPTP